MEADNGAPENGVQQETIEEESEVPTTQTQPDNVQEEVDNDQDKEEEQSNENQEATTEEAEAHSNDGTQVQTNEDQDVEMSEEQAEQVDGNQEEQADKSPDSQMIENHENVTDEKQGEEPAVENQEEQANENQEEEQIIEKQDEILENQDRENDYQEEMIEGDIIPTHEDAIETDNIPEFDPDEVNEDENVNKGASEPEVSAETEVEIAAEAEVETAADAKDKEAEAPTPMCVDEPPTDASEDKVDNKDSAETVSCVFIFYSLLFIGFLTGSNTLHKVLRVGTYIQMEISVQLTDVFFSFTGRQCGRPVYSHRRRRRSVWTGRNGGQCRSPRGGQ